MMHLLKVLLMSNHTICYWKKKKKIQYGKCPKILFTKAFDKMVYAKSVDPDQTSPEGAVWSGSTLFAILLTNA